MLVTKQFWRAHWLPMYSKKKKLTFYQSIFFYVPQKAESHTGLEQHEMSNSWQNFHFWKNYTFKNDINLTQALQWHTLHGKCMPLSPTEYRNARKTMKQWCWLQSSDQNNVVCFDISTFLMWPRNKSPHVYYLH